MTDDPFMTSTEARLFGGSAVKVFGQRDSRDRYHMPLLPGEQGVKSGGDWVPNGIQSVTNLVGAFEDTRGLSIWEQSLAFIGLALSPEIYEEVVLVTHAARAEGVDFSRLRNYPELKAALAGHSFDRTKQKASIIGRAKEAARASAAAQRGTNAHTAWEHRGATGELIGTEATQRVVTVTEQLLREAALERVPGLSERVVRNVEVAAAGRFDDILMCQRTGRLLMADLKTKATEFYSYMTVDAQLATYAYSEWLLAVGGRGYEPGPRFHVDQTEGVILHTPADGGPAFLRRADLIEGWETAKLARRVIEQRSRGKSAERFRNAAWRTEGVL